MTGRGKPGLSVGKLLPGVLARTVFPYTGSARGDVLVPAGTGEDAAVLDFGPWACVASTDPITGASERIGWYAVHVACNDLAATGAEPVALLLTLLLPEGTTEQAVEQVMSEAHQAAASLGVAIVGGHTEVTPAVSRIVVSATSIGRVRRNGWLRTGGARAGDDLVLTKAAGLEGTAILAIDGASRLEGRVAPGVLQRAREFLKELSVVPDAAAAVEAGATAMHDVTEGGVLGAACEMAMASGIGVEVDAALVPVRSETQAICAAYGLDPLRLISSGALLVSAPAGSDAATKIKACGIEAAVIGRFIDQGFFLIKEGGRTAVTPSSDDELWHVLS